MAILKIKTAQNSFSVNGTWYNKGALVIKESDSGLIYGGSIYNFDEVDCDGDTQIDKESLITWLNANLFKNGGGSGGGAVESVTGNLVSGTSVNPVINLPADVVKDSDLGDMALKDKVDISDIDTTNVANASSFLRGDGLWTSANRNFTGVTNVTADRTVQSSDLDRNRVLTFNGTDLVYTIPYPAGSFSQFGVVNILNIGSTAVEIAKQSGSVILYSEDDLTRVKAKSQATLTYLGSDTWFLSGGLSNA